MSGLSLCTWLLPILVSSLSFSDSSAINWIYAVVYIAFYYFTTVSFCNIVETSLYNGLKVSSCEVPVSLYFVTGQPWFPVVESHQLKFLVFCTFYIMWWAAVTVCRQSEPSSVASNSEAIIKHEMLDGSLTSRVFDKILMWSSYSIFDTHTHTHLTALSPGLPGSAGTRKVKPIWILLKQETVIGSGISICICFLSSTILNNFTAEYSNCTVQQLSL